MAGVTRSVSSRPPSVEESELRRGPWTIEEDTLLIHYIAGHGEGQWSILAKQAGLKRTGKSCRLRWLNYLKPDVKRGNLTLQEQLLILELHSKWGNRWSKIAQQLPGRTDNEIKNYWRTRVQKQARQHKIQSNNKRFLEAIRHWSVLQAIEETSNSCNFPPSLHSMSLPNSSEILPHHRQSSHDGGAPGLVVSANPRQHWPEFPQHPPSPCGEFGNVQLEETWSMDMVEQKQDPFSALEAWDVAEYDAQMAAAEWVLEDGMVESLWNLDDLI